MIYHAILASVFEPVMPLIATSTIADDAWSKLQRLYVNRSRTSVMQLKEKLTLIQRESRSVSEYLHAIKVFVDELAMIDSPVSMDGITLYVLNGLGPEFCDIAGPIRTHETSLMFEEFHDMLIDHKSYLKRVETSNSTLVATANTTQHRTTTSKFNRNQRSSTGSSSQNRTNSGRYNHKERFGKPHIVFQLCGKVGHSTKTCCTIFDKKSMNCATTTGSKDKKWLVDSATSHNITFDLANFYVHSKYNDTDEVIISDDSGILCLVTRTDHLSSSIGISDFGPLNYFLGVKVISVKHELFLSQQKYIRDLLSRIKMNNAKAVTTPLATKDLLQLHDGSSPADSTEYRRVIRALQYLSLT
ncbi:uncharacterized protein LOC131162872 [Malania oleifera]|uniref:uncharacterized protein LOC131162872 n=1 Tax=Malania oleifera TaxID=397392 RepID=UPI0025AEA1F3|nr:uncharacterized protein LOC131162872 [Malania oleifera]